MVCFSGLLRNRDNTRLSLRPRLLLLLLLLNTTHAWMSDCMWAVQQLYLALQ